MRGDIDDTVRISPRRRRLPVSRLASRFAASVAVAAGVWFVLVPRLREMPVRVADEQAIDANVATSLTVFRLAARPSIVVLDFPSLDQQGRMLDRLAALVEKNGLPHDRVLDDASLALAIKADGDTPATWYYGHDYRGSDVARFFALAADERVTLNDDERRLGALMHRMRGQTDGFGAVISVPRADPASGVDPAARAVILHHELSHGDYFTDPAYARAVSVTWGYVLTADERAKVCAYLAHEEYDPALTDLMQNEMQAYLVYTPAGKFFDPGRLGIAGDRLAVIRDALRGAGPRWLSPSQ